MFKEASHVSSYQPNPDNQDTGSANQNSEPERKQPEGFKQDLLARLNDQQKEAVCLKWGPSLIVAGAGSGKTTVLTRRIAYLISVLKADPAEIMAVTFTNKAAQEMKKRIDQIVGEDRTRWSWIGTFHSICARLLRSEIEGYTTPEGWTWTRNFVIYDETDSRSVIKAQIEKLDLDDKMFPPRELKHTISSLKNEGYTCALYAAEAGQSNYRTKNIAAIFNAYQAELARSNALDFDDLILVVSDLLRQNPSVRHRLRRRFPHLLIDEFQDTNKVQYDMVRLLSDVEDLEGETEEQRWNQRSLMVVGDVDQSIYSWRMADFRIFLGFQKDFKCTQLIKLEENYRSTGTILDVANSIIENNTERIEKVLRCNRGQGAKPQYYEAQDPIDEAHYVVEELKKLKARGRQFVESAILYRTNAQSRSIEEVLIRAAVPYTVIGATRFYDRQEIKDLIAYLKLVYNPKDNRSFLRVVNVPKRGLGKTSIEKLEAYADNKRISSLDAAYEADRIGTLSARAQKDFKEFAHLVRNRWPQVTEVVGLLELIIKDTKYIEMLEEQAESKKDELALGRIENVREFVAMAQEFQDSAMEPDLDSFLTRISLVSDVDKYDPDEDAVKLMTLHSAKGLEFPVVFLMGLEEGLFPHMRSLESDKEMEEERRLMYVGVTRAGDCLYLTRSRRRMLRMGADASFMNTVASRFLKEITPGLLSGYYPTESRDYEGSGYQRRGYEDDYGDDDGWDNRGRDDSQRSGTGRGGYGGGGYRNDERSGGRGYGGGRGSYGGGGANRDEYGRTLYTNDSEGRGSNGYGNGCGGNQGGNRGSGGYGNPGNRGRGSATGQSRSGNNSRGAAEFAGGGARPMGTPGRPANPLPPGYYDENSKPPQGGSSARGGSSSAQGGGSSAGGGRGSAAGGNTGRGSAAPRRAMRASEGSAQDTRARAQQERDRLADEVDTSYEKLDIGDRVQHVKFGVGEVVGVVGSGRSQFYNVQFEGSDKPRMLDPRLAKLIKLN